MKKLTAFIFSLLIIVQFNVCAQTENLAWAKQIGGINSDVGYSITIDLSGNVYTTGNFSGTSDFDPGPGIYNLTSVGQEDVFVSKVDISGKFVWAKQLGGSYITRASSIKVDNNGNVYITGSFVGSADFDPGDGLYNLNSFGQGDIFISKLDSSGSFVWAKQLGGTSGEQGVSVTVDNIGNVYTTGIFNGMADFDPSSNIYNLNSYGSNDIFISKLDVNGNFIWAKQLGGGSNDWSTSIAVDATGNVYTTGGFIATADFDPGVGVYNLTPANGNNNFVADNYISKLDAAGNFIWARQLSGATSHFDHSITVDNYGNLYATGSFVGTVDFDPGTANFILNSNNNSDDIFILNLDSNANFIWAKQLGGANADDGYSLALDNNGFIYTTGVSNGRGFFISKHNASGNSIWMKQINDSSANTSNSATGISITVDGNQNVYAIGTFQGTIDFDPNDSNYNLTSFGEADVFIVKFKQEQSLFIIPGIIISKSIIPAGQTMTIQGNNFSPNKIVTLNFYGAGGLYSTNLIASPQGAFSYIYNIPLNAQDGIASVSAYDSASQTYSAQPRSFQIQLTPANVQLSNINIISPQQYSTYSVGQQINFNWSDKLQRQYGNYYYPLVTSSGKRLYSYKVEYQIGASGQWKLVNTFQGSGAVNSLVSLKQIIQINTANSDCRIRVIDEYASSNVKITNAFPVNPVISNLKAELVWDKSFPEPSTFPQGVAADGVARLYLKVSKFNPATGSNLNSVTVLLNDDSHTTTSLLGKVKAATTLDAYSTEANDATAISITSSVLKNGGYWFWYVAPEDFSEDETTPYANLSERFVTLHVTGQFSNGTTDFTDVKVKIVRPPLLMVHGLASSENGWKNFHYNLNNTDYAFRFSPLFKQAKAVNLNPRSNFNENAYYLLTPNTTAYNSGSNRLNSFQGNLEEIRNEGYAANQVDYVCHSMGGSILRAAINVYGSIFYGSGIYKNYDKGFVHKAITINTPHNSSPAADAITEFVPQASTKVNIALGLDYQWFPNTPFVFDFIKPNITNNNIVFPWQATDAVKNLQVSDNAGGINFPTTIVKNHLIAGDIDLYNKETASFLAEMDKYMNLLHDILKIMRDVTPPGPVKTTLNGFLKLEKAVAVFTFIEWYSQQKGFPNFLGDGDFIVPLSSQLAGLTVNSPNVKVFANTSFFNANHVSITDRGDVGNWVKQLLNTPLSSSLFASVIPSTPSYAFNRVSAISSSTTNTLNSTYDTAKIKIISPSENSAQFADSALNIQFILKDTAGLAYIDVDFQGETITSTSQNPNQIIITQVDPSYIGNKLISVTSVYDRDNVTEYHTDTVTVNVQTAAQLIDFQAEPEAIEMVNNQVFYPNFKAVYNTSIAGLPNNTSGITVYIADTSIIKYNALNKSFTAISDTGSTFIVFNYKNFSDTVYVYFNSPDNSSVNIACSQSNTFFFAGTNDNTKTYQWQVDTGTGFIDISDNTVYTGANTPTLSLSNIPSNWYGYRFQCSISDLIGTVFSPVTTMKFSSTWMGTSDNAWENSANWGCGSVPDENTDVIINSSVPFNPVVNTDASCRSLVVKPSTIVTVTTGHTLSIKGK